MKAKGSPPIIELTDLRDQSPESLPEVIATIWGQTSARYSAGLLTVSRRPGKKWTQTLSFARPLILCSAPLYELILWVDRELGLTLPQQTVEDQQELLAGYHRLFSGEGDQKDYLERLHRHITEQEAELYPCLAALAPVERATRELGYEHRGLEKGAEKLKEALAAHRLGNLAKKDKDRLDLDFFHLLEHHLERERDALYPAWIFLSEAHQKD